MHLTAQVLDDTTCLVEVGFQAMRDNVPTLSAAIRTGRRPNKWLQVDQHTVVHTWAIRSEQSEAFLLLKVIDK